MATSTSWTLWKRLPPRYQLSVRTFVDDDDIIQPSPPGSPKQQRRGSARQSRSELRSPKQKPSSPTPGQRRTVQYVSEPPSPGQKRSIQNIPDFPARDISLDRPSSPSGSFFPYRKSGYIDHFKTQQRVNSARVRMATDDDCGSRSPSPQGRFNKAPSNTDSKTVQDGGCPSAKSRVADIQHSFTRCEHHTKTRTDGEKNGSNSCPQYSNKMEQRKYLVRETDEGTMYIDRGKIIYFRRYKSSPVSQASYFSRYSDGGYLASIRREYLTKPRLLAMGPDRRNEQSETKIHQEREYYNRKVAHILDYYSYPDEDNISVDDLSKYTSSTKRVESPRKAVNMTSRNVKRIYFAYPKPEHEVRPLQVQDLQADPGSYFKMNQQLKLHDRDKNFYLKTPSHKPIIREADMLDCACGMCRIEMQLALMAQAEADHHAKFVQSKTLKSKMSEKISDKKQTIDTELKLDLSSIEQEANEKTQIDSQNIGNKEDKGTSPSKGEANKQEQVLTVTIPKMETNRENSEVTKENATQTERAKSRESS